VANMELRYALSDDKSSMSIELRDKDANNPLGHIILDASELESVIRNLGKVRSGMAEPVAPELDPMSRIETEMYPAWKVPDTHNSPHPGVMLCLRHPGLGWLGFFLDRDRALLIGDALEKYSPPPLEPAP
jgi:hypothetical protein